MPLNDPLFFRIKHPQINVELYFLGIHHALPYEELPDWCLSKIKKMDVLFHELDKKF